MVGQAHLRQLGRDGTKKASRQSQFDVLGNVLQGPAIHVYLTLTGTTSLNIVEDQVHPSWCSEFIF